MEIKDLAVFLGLTETEARMLDERAKSLGLDPVSGQINLLKRRKKEKDEFQRDKWVTVYAFQVGIEGFRLIAERSGNYEGQDPIEYVVDRNSVVTRTDVTLHTDKPIAAIAKVYRKGIPRAFVGTAHYRDYVGTTNEGHVTSTWKKWTIMLAKCAEAAAFRKGFSELNLGKVYEAAEITAGIPDEENVDGNGNSNGNASVAASILSGKPDAKPKETAATEEPAAASILPHPPWAGFDPKPASDTPAPDASSEVTAPAPEVVPATPATPVAKTEQEPPAAPKPEPVKQAPPEKQTPAKAPAKTAKKTAVKMCLPVQIEQIQKLSEELGDDIPKAEAFEDIPMTEATAMINKLFERKKKAA